MLRKYVDDVNLCLALIEDGWHWQQEGRKLPAFVWTQEREDEDKILEVSPEEKTLKKIQDLANMLVEGIKFTIDLPGRHTSGRVPMLDLAVWLDDSRGELVRSSKRSLS